MAHDGTGEHFARRVGKTSSLFSTTDTRRSGNYAPPGPVPGNSDIFKEVRVEYNFDPINGVYREIAIVRDESLWGRNNVYTLQSPLIKTEKRALKVAEAILANLNRYRGLLNGDDIPRTTEIILSFDDEFDEFSRKLQQLSREWEASGLRESQR